VLVATADSRGAIHNSDGLDIAELMVLKQDGKSVSDYQQATRLDKDGLLDIECDIWIPAARPDVINEQNVGRLKTRLIVQGANIPVTPGAEQKLHERGILCVPDFIANAGGVICAAMEYHGASEGGVFQVIEDKVRRNTEIVLSRSKQEQILPRQAAIELARERVEKAMSFRRFSLFSTAPDFI